MALKQSTQANGSTSDVSGIIVYDKIEGIIKKMQNEKTGVPIRNVKSFLCKIPSVVTGTDIVQWLMNQLKIDEPVEALHLGTLLAAHGYFFPISDHVLILTEDSTFYRFQTPYFWLSNCWEPQNIDYAVYLCKRAMQNKARLELADYEADSLARLQRLFARKWEFIFMQAEAQAKVDKKRDKVERKILDSQERAFWDVHRPVPGCVNVTEIDIKKSCRWRNPRRTKTSVYNLRGDGRCFAPLQIASPRRKPPSLEQLRERISFMQNQLDRHCLKISKVAESLTSYCEQYSAYDPIVTVPELSNPWISNDAAHWDTENSNEIGTARVHRWGFSLEEMLKDLLGQDLFLSFLQSEFSSENLRFWLAVQDLRRRPWRAVSDRAEEIWCEFLAPGAPSPINLDSQTYDRAVKAMDRPTRHTFEEAQEQIYKLMKSDSYARFLRSSLYQDLLHPRKKGKLQLTAKRLTGLVQST
uniref:regulator of G-protein signaling 7-like isoform X1 n=2 Tax=Myxine glutinosa TaxID=7769 RepID=UPI00358F3BC0